MKIIQRSAITLAIFSLSQGALANGWSVGLLGGQSSFNDFDDGCQETIPQTTTFVNGIPIIADVNCNIDDTDTALGINVGYDITQHFGFEAGYVELGQVSLELSGQLRIGSAIEELPRADLSVDASAVYISLVGTLPISEKLSISARLGAVDVSGDASLSSQGISDSTDFEGEAELVAGASLNYFVSNKVSIQLRYDDFDIATMSGLGLKYHF